MHHKEAVAVDRSYTIVKYTNDFGDKVNTVLDLHAVLFLIPVKIIINLAHRER